jgi:hypothetical protein
MLTARIEVLEGAISDLGQTRKSSWPTPTSALPLKADIRRAGWHVRKVPTADIANLVWNETGRQLRRPYSGDCNPLILSQR